MNGSARVVGLAVDETVPPRPRVAGSRIGIQEYYRPNDCLVSRMDLSGRAPVPVGTHTFAP